LKFQASLELAKWLISFKETGPKEGYGWRDIRWILELGCGCGFLAVAGLKIFPAPTVVQKYIATDGSFTALERCRENVSANFTDTTETNAVQFEELDWDSDAEKLRKLVEVNTEKYGRGLLLGAGNFNLNYAELYLYGIKSNYKLILTNLISRCCI
jgi:hypothetical protein